MLVLKEHAKKLLLSGVMYLVSLALEFVPIYITFCILSNFASTNITDTNQVCCWILDFYFILDCILQKDPTILLIFIVHTDDSNTDCLLIIMEQC